MEIITTSITKPPRMIIYGEHKTGKSSFVASCPHPIFIQTEDGLEGLNTKAFKLCTSYQDIIDQLDYLCREKHPFKTLGFDSLDWAQELIFREVCKRYDMPEINPPKSFGVGFARAEDLWRSIMKRIRYLNEQKKMMIAATAHYKIKKIEDPMSDNYDKYVLDLQDRGASIWLEYVDIIGFMTRKTIIIEKKEEFGSISRKAKNLEEICLKLTPSGGYEAGNRFSLPDSLTIPHPDKGSGWDVLSAEIAKFYKKDSAGNLSDIKKKKEEEKKEREENKENKENKESKVA